MDHGNSALWGSISALITAVIAVLAFVRGSWEIPLLLAVFALWGLWVVLKLLLPSWRESRAFRKLAREEQKKQTALTSAGVANPDMAQLLLRHVNYRVSAALRSASPDAHWEWTMDDPTLFAAQCGTGRIRVYGIPGFDYADVSIDRSANLSCTLVKLASLAGTSDAEPPNRQPLSPEKWYELRARDTLEQLVADLNSKGHSRLFLKDDGEICIRPVEGGEDLPKGRLKDFPAKVYWSKLVEFFTRAGLTATELENCIQLSW